MTRHPDQKALEVPEAEDAEAVFVERPLAGVVSEGVVAMLEAALEADLAAEVAAVGFAVAGVVDGNNCELLASDLVAELSNYFNCYYQPTLGLA